MTDGNMAPGAAQMSPVASFADMANHFAMAQRAMERLPQLEAERDAANNARDEAQRHAQELELMIHQLRDDNNSLAAKLREVETERDTFRGEALALTSVRDRLVSAFTSAADMVGDEIRQLVPQPEPASAEGARSTAEAQANDPFVGSTGVTQASAHTAESTSELVPAGSVERSNRFSGRYYAHPDIPYTSFEDWLAGGGTEYGYTWRKAHEYDSPDRNRLYPTTHFDDGKPETQSQVDPMTDERKSYY